jgi:hypothetical protein
LTSELVAEGLELLNSGRLFVGNRVRYPSGW